MQAMMIYRHFGNARCQRIGRWHTIETGIAIDDGRPVTLSLDFAPWLKNSADSRLLIASGRTYLQSPDPRRGRRCLERHPIDPHASKPCAKPWYGPGWSCVSCRHQVWSGKAKQ